MFPKKISFFSDCFTVIRGAPRLVISAPRLVVGIPRLVVGAPRLVAGAPKSSQVHCKCSPALQGVFILITITLLVLLYQSSEIAVTPKAHRNAHLGSDILQILTHLSLHSTSSQILLEASSD
jgi:hypothetical protein